MSKPTREVAKKAPPRAHWTFLTNHAHVLLCVGRDASARIRDIASAVGITERAVQRILVELEEGGYLTHEREGRRNVYRVKPSLPLRHPLERHKKIAMLLSIVSSEVER